MNSNQNTHDSEELYVVKSRFRADREVETQNRVYSSKEKALDHASKIATPMEDNKRGTDFLVATVYEREGFVNFSDNGNLLTSGEQIAEFDSRERDPQEILQEDDVVSSVGKEGVGIVREVRDHSVVVQHKEEQAEYHPEELEVIGWADNRGEE